MENENGYCRLAFIGMFRLDRKFICSEPDIAQLVLAQGIVVRAEGDFATDSIIYTMYSPTLFEEVDEGNMAPLYEIGIGETFEGELEVYAEKVAEMR